MRPYTLFGFACLALLIFIATPARAADSDPAFEAFVTKANRELKAAGKSYAGCKAEVVDKQPDGPGRIITFACSFMPYACAFVVVPDEDAPEGFAARALACEENPSYVETPKGQTL